MSGDEWVDIPGYNGRYQANRCGAIRSLYRGKWKTLKFYIGSVGYYGVGLYEGEKQKTKNVHTLIAATFLGPRPAGHFVCHNNGVRTDNRVENLRYDTPTGNQADRAAHGTDLKGSDNPMAKLSEDRVREIKNLRGTDTYRGIARDFGVSFATVQKIMSGTGWRHVS